MSMRAGIIMAVAAGGILVASHWAAYRHGISMENADRRTEVAELVREQNQRLGQLQDEHSKALTAELQRRLDEQDQHARDMAALDVKFTKEMTDAKRQAEADVAAVRAGAVRVRERFTCPSAGAAGASGAGTAAGRTASVGDAAQAAGLQAADAEFLLSEAGRADEVTLQLQACQEIVRRDRAGASGVPQP